tara:strand:+ start:45 stop:509 length:465 start_codon:yes stop_codon:yes gene_type:complete
MLSGISPWSVLLLSIIVLVFLLRKINLNRYSKPQAKEEYKDDLSSALKKIHEDKILLKRQDNRISVLESYLSLFWLVYAIFILITGLTIGGRCYDPSILDPTEIIAIGKTILFLNIMSFILLLFTDKWSKSHIFLKYLFIFLMPASLSILIRCY